MRSKEYQERLDHQLNEWVKGNPIHNEVEDECCPDFSCCRPELLIPEEKRIEYANATEEERYQKCGEMLGALFAGHPVYIAGKK